MMYDPRNNQSFYNQKHKATGGTRDVLTHTMSAKFKQDKPNDIFVDFLW